MADTIGLMKTRGEWMAAVENGETNLTHAEWYKQKKLKSQVAGEEDKKPESLAELSIK